jgi:transposase
MKAYSMDLRKRVLADCDVGLPTKQVAEKYDVSRAWVRRLKQRRRETGEIGPRPCGGARRIVIDREKLSSLVAQQPDATLVELRERLGVDCTLAAICIALRELKLTFKKSPCGPPSRTDQTSRKDGRSGGRGKSGSIRGGSSSSTKPGRTPR